MQVQFIHAGPHPNREDIWIGAVTTDDPDKFKEWLVTMMPSHKVVAHYIRSSNAVRTCGGYPYRMNVHCENMNQQMIFKMAWK